MRAFSAGVVLATFGSVFAAAPQDPEAAREQLNPVVWTQTAIEFPANTLSVYRAAKARLAPLRRSRTSASVEQDTSGTSWVRRPRAIVVDIDETVLDNSAYNAALVKQHRSYDDPDYRWADWVGDKQALEVKGAAEFITEARHLGYAVVFITNRECARDTAYGPDGQALTCPQEAATVENLNTVLGYHPEASDVLLRFERGEWKDSDKTARRQAVAAQYHIAMLIGDSLGDFVSPASYDPAVNAAHWGNDWFALPNAMYGSWEDGKRKVEEKYAALRPWPHGPAPTVTELTRDSSNPTTLAIVSWNLEWLGETGELRTQGFWSKCAARNWPNEQVGTGLPRCSVYGNKGIRTEAQFETKKLVPLRNSLQELAQRGMDILTVQEVRGPAALQAVLPDGYQIVCFTTKEDAQNVGYAARSAIAPQLACREITSIGVGRVRNGLEVKFNLGPEPVSLLSVHLKASCPTARMDTAANNNCRTLQQQVAPLEVWIEEQATSGRSFAVIGDWNRDLEQEIDGGFPARSDGSDPTRPIVAPKVRNLFPELNDGVPVASSFSLAAIDRSPAASGCHANLDQIVASKQLISKLDPGTLTSNTLSGALVAGESGASDHCAIETVMRLK